MGDYYQLFNVLALAMGVFFLGVVLFIGIAIACVRYGYKMGRNMEGSSGGVVDESVVGRVYGANKNRDEKPFMVDEDPWENTVLNSRTSRPTVPGDGGGRV